MSSQVELTETNEDSGGETAPVLVGSDTQAQDDQDVSNVASLSDVQPSAEVITDVSAMSEEKSSSPDVENRSGR